jgi:hypothetical protein
MQISARPEAPGAELPAMDRAETLRRRVAIYRRHLQEGATAELAAVYLREIASAEAELAAIEGEDQEPADRE